MKIYLLLVLNQNKIIESFDLTATDYITILSSFSLAISEIISYNKVI
jgi:hypothetical protein